MSKIRKVCLVPSGVIIFLFALAEVTGAGLEPQAKILVRAEGKTKTGDIAGALADYDQAVQNHPNDADALALRCDARFMQHDWDGVIADCTRLLDLSRSEAGRPIVGSDVSPVALFYCDRGDAKAAKGDFTGALADYELARKRDSRCASALLGRGKARALTGNAAGALADIREALGSNRDYAHLLVWGEQVRTGDRGGADNALADYLSRRRKAGQADWVASVGKFLLGQMSENDLFHAAVSPNGGRQLRQQCEATYYCGMKRLLAGEREQAVHYFRICLATNLIRCPEYRLAAAELGGLQP